MKAPGRLLAAATIALLVLIWGTTWAAIRICLVGIPPLTGVALRFAIAGVILAMVARAMGVPLAAINRRDRWLRVLHGLLSFCVSYGVVFWSEQWVPSGLAAVLFATFPLVVAVMAHFSLPGERLTLASTLGTVVGFAGIVVIFAEDFELLGGSQVVVAALVILVGPIACAGANVAFKRWGEGIHPVPFNAVAMLLSSLVMGPLAVIVERGRPITFATAPVLALLYMAVLGSAVTFSLYFWLLQHMKARQLALVAYAAPVVALLVGALFLDEPVTTYTLAGSVMVVAGVALASHDR